MQEEGEETGGEFSGDSRRGQVGASRGHGDTVAEGTSELYEGDRGDAEGVRDRQRSVFAAECYVAEREPTTLQPSKRSANSQPQPQTTCAKCTRCRWIPWTGSSSADLRAQRVHAVLHMQTVGTHCSQLSQRDSSSFDYDGDAAASRDKWCADEWSNEQGGEGRAGQGSAGSQP